MASASATGKLSREEFRRQKDLDAARKAGTAPAALDEEGKPINPHIPRAYSIQPIAADCVSHTLATTRIYRPSTMVSRHRRPLTKPPTYPRIRPLRRQARQLVRPRG
ncbi:hypothetical protein NUW54_g13267 [Trametes sanguinea]|uniref:Uncharacterized protein n=1 Tax=Trametes sanguinea TaxID=158606 RepID=A0ACC1MPS3_9APHY|nr:hypothetical protein NUW54_g13267 [Trametes sanguinea]